MNHYLQAMGCIVYPPTKLVAFLLADDWIVSNTNKPGKVYIIMIGCTDILSNYRADIERRLVVIIKTNEGEGIDEASIEVRCRVEFYCQENVYELNQLLKSSVCLFIIILRENYVVVNELQTFCKKVEEI